MNPILRNVLAVIAGAVVGSVINMGLISISSSIIPLPPGVDTSTDEGLKAAIPLFEPKHFIMPFLAHAFGTFVGALVAALIAANRKMMIAIIVGVLFLIGGIMAVVMFPAPLWFEVIDLVVAYIPMAYLGGLIASRRTASSQTVV